MPEFEAPHPEADIGTEKKPASWLTLEKVGFNIGPRHWGAAAAAGGGGGGGGGTRCCRDRGVPVCVSEELSSVVCCDVKRGITTTTACHHHRCPVHAMMRPIADGGVCTGEDNRDAVRYSSEI